MKNTDISPVNDMIKSTYRYVPLRREDKYSFDVERSIAAIDGSFSLIYIDNPNNSTGQSITLENIERVLVSAERFGIYVIIDEA